MEPKSDVKAGFSNTGPAQADQTLDLATMGSGAAGVVHLANGMDAVLARTEKTIEHLLEQGNDSRALAVIQATLRRVESSPEHLIKAQIQKAHLIGFLGNIPVAVETFEAALKTAKASNLVVHPVGMDLILKQSKFLLKNGYPLSGKELLLESLVVLDSTGLKTSQEVRMMHLLLANTYMLERNNREAEGHLYRSIVKNSFDIVSLSGNLRIAQFYQMEGNFELAERFF